MGKVGTGPGEGDRCRFLPRYQQRHQLISQGFIPHALPPIILGCDQLFQQALQPDNDQNNSDALD